MHSTQNGQRDHVVFVHGLFASKHIFLRLNHELKKQRFSTTNWSYWSIRGDIHELGQRLNELLRTLEADSSVDRVHVVTHSMGSIITRAMMVEHELEKLHRVVMLAPPHRGSRVASNLAPILGPICPPLHQLSDKPDSSVNQLAIPSNTEIGIVAAARDRVVAVESTHLATQADHTIVNYGHTSMLFTAEVCELVKRFLSHGSFTANAQVAART